MIGLPKALALPGVVTRRFERGAGHAHRLRGDADAPAFEVGQGDPVAFALLAQPVGHGTRTSSKRIWQVSEACWPSLSSTRATL